MSDDHIKRVYAVANQMRDENVSRVRRLHLAVIALEAVVVGLLAFVSPYFAFVLPLPLAHTLLVPFLLRRTRGFETWKWNFILNHMPDPEHDTPEWIRQMLHLYSKRMKYRPVEGNDPADWWKWN